MPNIIGGKINFFCYGGNGRGRLSGTLQVGEVNLSTVVTPARVAVIYAANPAGGFRSYTPGSQFSSLSALETGESYFVDAKQDFDFPAILPDPDAALQASAIDFLQQGAPSQWVDRTDSTSAAIELFFTGRDNKDVVNQVNGQPKTEGGGTPNFTTITIEGGRAIAAATPNDYITLNVPGLAGSYNDFTLMFSGRVVDGAGTAIILALLKSAGVTAIQLGGPLPTTEGPLAVLSADLNDAVGATDTVSAGALIRNTYTTYVVRRQGNTIALFRNGAEVNSRTTTIGAITINGNLILGRTVDGASSNKARLQTAMVGFWGRALTNTEITTLHTTPFRAYRDLASMATPSPSPTPNPTPTPTPSTVSVYAIHNSVFDTCGVYTGAFQPAIATKGKTYNRGRHMIPGAPLSWIWEHPNDGFRDPSGYQTALTQSWDKLILQPFDRAITGPDGDLQMASNFMNIAIAANPNIDTYIYSRWVSQSKAPGGNYQTEWNRALGTASHVEYKAFFVELVTQLRAAYPGRSSKILMIPAGDIMNELDIRMKAGQIPGYNNVFQLYADDIHLNDVGSYICGCGLFATIYKESPIGLPTTAYNFSNQSLGDLLADAVWDIVNGHPFSGVNV